MGALRSLEGQSIVIEELATHYTIGDSVVGLPSSLLLPIPAFTLLASNSPYR